MNHEETDLAKELLLGGFESNNTVILLGQTKSIGRISVPLSFQTAGLHPNDANGFYLLLCGFKLRIKPDISPFCHIMGYHKLLVFQIWELGSCWDHDGRLVKVIGSGVGSSYQVSEFVKKDQ